jgi:Phytanoyl-CoA dioxygenase (PhyH)
VTRLTKICQETTTMSTPPATAPPIVEPNVEPLREALYRDGIVGLPGAFPASWADDLHEDFTQAFAAARSYPEGTVSRGPNRYYFAVHPERIRGFVDLVTHPLVTGLSAAVLGPDYRIVELGFDVPLPGAVDQPWHRDFRMPPETRDHGRLTSLAFNVSTVDVTPDLAPFEIAPGTHWDRDDDFAHGMFPPTGAAARYRTLGNRRHPRRGDMSARTGLTLHRGTANHSTRSRAVLILGVVADDVDPGEAHDLVVTRAFCTQLPDAVHRRLRCTVVDELQPLVQKHDIEGLLMGG